MYNDTKIHLASVIQSEQSLKCNALGNHIYYSRSLYFIFIIGTVQKVQQQANKIKDN